jgi:hypothetical protein
VLDPCAGLGALTEPVIARLKAKGTSDPSAQVVAVERDRIRAAQLRAKRIPTICDDFLIRDGFGRASFSAVVANPPFIPIRELPEIRQQLLFEKFPSLDRCGSIWKYFVVKAVRLLEPEGRLGFVLPREIVGSDYGRRILDELADRFESIDIHALDWAVFGEVQVRAVLLLCEGAGRCHTKRIHVLRDPAALREALAVTSIPTNGATAASPRTKSLQDQVEQIALANGFISLSSLVDTSLGVVTGCDRFFLFTEEEAKTARIPSCCLAKVLPSGRLFKGWDFDLSAYRRLRTSGAKSLLLRICDKHLGRMPKWLSAYQQRGEEELIHRGFKCSHREPWYKVPVGDAPDAFLTYMVHDAPRIIANSVGSHSTNRLHALTFKNPTSALRLWAPSAFENVITRCSAELAGVTYGGGVLKIEPKSVSRIYVPRVEDTRFHLDDSAVAGLAQALVLDGQSHEARVLLGDFVRTRWQLASKDKSFLHGAYQELVACRLARRDVGARKSGQRGVAWASPQA